MYQLTVGIGIVLFFREILRIRSTVLVKYADRDDQSFYAIPETLKIGCCHTPCILLDCRRLQKTMTLFKACVPGYSTLDRRLRTLKNLELLHVYIIGLVSYLSMY